MRVRTTAVLLVAMLTASPLALAQRASLADRVAALEQRAAGDQGATELVNQTILGSGTMLVESGRSATQLREMVTSPAGTTAAALRELDERGVRAGFLAAVQACHDRSVEMSSR